MKKKKQPSRKGSIALLTVLCVLIAVLGVLAFVPFSYDEDGYRSYTSFAGAIELGLDLKGGVYAVLTPVFDEDNEDLTVEEQEQTLADSLQASDGVLSILRYRLTQMGYPEATVAWQTDSYGETRIRVEIPEVSSPADVFSTVAQRGVLEFTADESVTGVTNPIVTGDDITAAIATYDSSSSSYAVAVQMSDEVSDDFEKATSALASESGSLTITMDGETITTATVSSAISNGQGMITGLSTAAEAQNLAILIMSGSLPVEFEYSEPTAIATLLGEKSVQTALIAGAACLALVLVLMLIFYRGLGLIADLALLIYVVLLTFFMAEIPGIQLTLAGAVGLLVGFVLAADANIIIFERIKDEFRSGRTIVASVQAGLHRAIAPVLDTHIAVGVLAAALWLFGGSAVRSFGILLFLGTALSLFGAMAVTRLLLRTFLPINSTGEKFYNLKREEEPAQ